MLRSMTAFGAASVTIDQGTLNLEIRSVNSRYLDLHFRLPDELRTYEMRIREQLTRQFERGKIEVRANLHYQHRVDSNTLNLNALESAKEIYRAMKNLFPETPAPRFNELINWPGVQEQQTFSWQETLDQALQQATQQLQDTREREGQRLTQIMQDSAAQAQAIVNQVRTDLPARLIDFQERLKLKIQDTLNTAFPQGFEFVTGAELMERITHESSLFSIRLDVAEELTRLEAHLSELLETLAGKHKKKGIGKRLDFLFQEMNREANTLGSKASNIEISRASMDLKLLIEQMREQVQNIE